MENEPLTEDKKLELKIEEFVNRTSDIYDLNDVVEWIIYNKEELAEILR